MSKSIFSYLNLSDRYERKARLLPAVLTLLLLAPPLIVLELTVSNWVGTLLGGGGVSAVMAVALSHLSSAFGNRYQQYLWPLWPHDSPTNIWLSPDNSFRSAQQKKIWYGAIHRLTGLNIEEAIKAGDHEELKAVINDAVTSIRNQLWSLDIAVRLQINNEDYGFARNLAGLRWVWVVFSTISATSCWVLFYMSRGELIWAIISSIFLIISIILGFFVLPEYVKQKALHYAESFFAAMIELDKS